MSFQVLSFAGGFLAFVIFATAFLVLKRLKVKMGWFALQIVVGGSVHVLSTILFLLLWKGFIYWYALGVFAVLWFCFFTLSTAVYVSVSANILRTIRSSPGQSLTVDQIFKMCVQKPFEERAIFLQESGLVKEGRIGFKVTEAGIKNARFVHFMRHLLGLDGSGLYSAENRNYPSDLRATRTKRLI
jgi:hypothetical protein